MNDASTAAPSSACLSSTAGVKQSIGKTGEATEAVEAAKAAAATAVPLSKKAAKAEAAKARIAAAEEVARAKKASEAAAKAHVVESQAATVSAAQNRAERKSRLAMEKLGLRAVDGVFRMTMRTSGGAVFVVKSPDVFKHPQQVGLGFLKWGGVGARTSSTSTSKGAGADAVAWLCWAGVRFACVFFVGFVCGERRV